MKLFTDGSEDSVGILRYQNDPFGTLDPPFISLSHTHLNDHLAETSNIAEHFYYIEPEIIHGTFMYTIQWI